jgi:phosphotransferase system enzyme I (PtsI)
MKRFVGIGVSPGIVAGRAAILIHRARVLRYRVAPGRLDEELSRLERSRLRSRQQLGAIRSRVTRQRGPDLAALFDAQLLMLDDPMLISRAIEIVRQQQVNAEWAIQQAFGEFSAVFDEVADPYLRERRGDVADVVGRLKMNLRQGLDAPRDLLRALDEFTVLVADELTPSLAAQVDWTKVRGFAADAGSPTHHTAILARSLDVPAVVGLHDASGSIDAGSLVVLDGETGEVTIDPPDDLLERALRRSRDRRPAVDITAQSHQPASTADGLRVRLEANIEFPEDLAAARYAGAEGIGLYRSEFLLSTGACGMGDEDRQYETYRMLVEGMSPGSVTVRTFDLDEGQPFWESAASGSWADGEHAGRRPGRRGLGLSLSRPDLFRVQLRALLRAARHGSMRIMFPFVTGVEQLRAARRLVSEAAAELAGRGERVPTVPVGAMIEVPAAAYTADLLAREVDFFTIGTNDLIQYCLAVDRADERMSPLYEPLHPAILRLIVMIRQAASRGRIPVSLCGEMAADPSLLALLVGLGLREFSMAPAAIPVVKRVLGEARSDELRATARRVVKLTTVDEIERELQTGAGRLSAAREEA